MSILNLNEFLNGILSLICVIISLIIGLTIISKYLKTKQVTFLYVGLTWIGIFTPWLPSAVAFLSALISIQISAPIYFLISGVAPVFIVYVWMMAFCFLTDKKKYIPFLVTLEIAIIEIIYLFFVFSDISLVGSLTSTVDARYEIIGIVLYLNLMIIFISTTTIFGYESLRSFDKEIKLKGIFILIGSYMFIISAFFDTAIDLDLVTLTIIRILLMISGVLFYFGFIFPKPIKDLFIKE